jgi:hypothetical protein
MTNIKKIISLGPNCSTSITMRHLGIRNASYPWDWAANTEIKDIINVILNKQNFKVEEWDKLKNIGLFLPHDLDGDDHGKNENLFENTDRLNKYKRRFKRFFEDIEGENTYLVRFGDGKDLDILEDLLPKCKILHIPNGNPDSLETHKIIMDAIGEQNDFSKIIVCVSYYDKADLPISSGKIIEFIKDQNEKLFYSKSPISEESFNLVFEKDQSWSTIESFYEYLRNKIYKITGVEYAIC